MQWPAQPTPHPTLQLLLHPIGAFSAAFIIVGVPANTTTARMGSAPFAARLKNSRRDWSSSFLFFFSITKRFVPINTLIRQWLFNDMSVYLLVYRNGVSFTKGATYKFGRPFSRVLLVSVA